MSGKDKGNEPKDAVKTGKQRRQRQAPALQSSAHIAWSEVSSHEQQLLSEQPAPFEGAPYGDPLAEVGKTVKVILNFAARHSPQLGTEQNPLIIREEAAGHAQHAVGLILALHALAPGLFYTFQIRHYERDTPEVATNVLETYATAQHNIESAKNFLKAKGNNSVKIDQLFAQDIERLTTPYGSNNWHDDTQRPNVTLFRNLVSTDLQTGKGDTDEKNESFSIAYKAMMEKAFVNRRGSLIDGLVMIGRSCALSGTAKDTAELVDYAPKFQSSRQHGYEEKFGVMKSDGTPLLINGKQKTTFWDVFIADGALFQHISNYDLPAPTPSQRAPPVVSAPSYRHITNYDSPALPTGQPPPRAVSAQPYQHIPNYDSPALPTGQLALPVSAVSPTEGDLNAVTRHPSASSGGRGAASSSGNRGDSSTGGSRGRR